MLLCGSLFWKAATVIGLKHGAYCCNPLLHCMTTFKTHITAVLQALVSYMQDEPNRQLQYTEFQRIVCQHDILMFVSVYLTTLYPFNANVKSRVRKQLWPFQSFYSTIIS